MPDNDNEYKQMLESHIEKFDEFHDDWKYHRREAKNAMSKIDAVHTAIGAMSPQMTHLSQLPTIGASMAALERTVSTQVRDLIASGSKSDETRARLLERMMLVCLVVVIFLGVALVITFIRESNKNFRLNKDGFEFTNPVQHTSPESTNIPETIKKTP